MPVNETTYLSFFVTIIHILKIAQLLTILSVFPEIKNITDDGFVTCNVERFDK